MLRVFTDGEMVYLNHVRIDGFDGLNGATELKVTFEETENKFHDDFANNSLENPIIMHKTGLKDANDKDLYYGDLIVFYYGWRKENMVWDVEDVTDLEHIFNSINESGATFEIIGNKHENPELL